MDAHKEKECLELRQNFDARKVVGEGLQKSPLCTKENKLSRSLMVCKGTKLEELLVLLSLENDFENGNDRVQEANFLNQM